MGTKPGKADSSIIRKRCPQCKKIRAYRFSPNYYPEDRIMWKRIIPDGPKVCHICVERFKINEKDSKI